MSESVEQAATVEGWKARAEREAAAIIAEVVATTSHYMPTHPANDTYPELVKLVAIGWLQGASFGAHDALGHVEQAFGIMRDEL